MASTLIRRLWPLAEHGPPSGVGFSPQVGPIFIFVDESWQEIGGQQVAALGAVAIRRDFYNEFCRATFAIKKRWFNATELSDHEFKGSKCLTRWKFRRGQSNCIDAVSDFLAVLSNYKAKTFAVWTTDPALLQLRSTSSTILAAPYGRVILDVRHFMVQHRSRLAELTFDQRDYGSDATAACAVQNYLARSNVGFRTSFVLVPNFAVSSVSPGLQAADVIAHLACHLSDGGASRPELAPFMGVLTRLGHTRGNPPFKCVRQV